ncbi:MAG: phosphoribosylformylglycinamidine synthase subunit PurL [Phycisphaerales bacterium]|nr:phosphoribosylformylglycinamidine synthase subunit PurL [Phycisphaerales bacterium]
MTVHRIEVRPSLHAGDPAGQSALEAIHAMPGGQQLRGIATAAVYLIEADLDVKQVEHIGHTLLAHPVSDELVIGASPIRSTSVIEVHPLPGVMDPDADSIEAAIERLLGIEVQVRTGRRYDLDGVDATVGRELASKCLANPLIHDVHIGPAHPESFPIGHAHDMSSNEVPLCDLKDDALLRLSREGHLFLSLDEMHALQDHFRALGREPRDIELETLAQTWSEHCVHKTLKATVDYAGELPGGGIPSASMIEDGTLRIPNLLKCTVAAATHQLMEEGLDQWCLSVFVDNAGIVGFDEDTAVCFKVETHNHPSALEPYGGAATGIGGCIRDVIGTGLAARPIAATDVFCVGSQTMEHIPDGCLHPRRILHRVVEGVRDYGNRMGIPTLDGTVWFDNRYVGNPLVFCGCVGVMPRDLVSGAPRAGDRIIAMGGRTGRDGVHGATFSSAELTDTHADEFSHAVQIGNAITEKKVLDAIMAARDHASGCLFTAITDCGAGGFSSAVGEMGEELGAVVNLEQAPLKYTGLTPTEIWISEAQERMVLAVSADRLEALASICEEHEVEWCDLGEFGTPQRELILRYGGSELGRLSMQFMHEGLPDRVRQASWNPTDVEVPAEVCESDLSQMLHALMSHPNIASKRSIIRQYDHEVQGRTMIKPLVGPDGEGPSDAAVITPVRGSTRGLAIGSGLATGLAADPYDMVLAAIDECVRNLVCVGADPEQIAILDNYCWPGCEDEERMGELVRASAACLHGGLAYRTPFISGKDSLNNQFTTEAGETIRIPPTMLISGFGIVSDVRQCVTMDAKAPDNLLVLVGETTDCIGGSHLLLMSQAAPGSRMLPRTDLKAGPANARVVAGLIAEGLVRSAHDPSEGGVLVAAAEMACAGGLGVALDPQAVQGNLDSLSVACFAETPSRYLLEVTESNLKHIIDRLGETPCSVIGRFTADPVMTAGDRLDLQIETLQQAWLTGMECS